MKHVGGLTHARNGDRNISGVGAREAGTGGMWAAHLVALLGHVMGPLGWIGLDGQVISP